MLDLLEAWDTEHVHARAMRVKDASGNEHIGIPIKYSQEPGQINAVLPGVGQHTAEILEGLHLTEAQRHEILSSVK